MNESPIPVLKGYFAVVLLLIIAISNGEETTEIPNARAIEDFFDVDQRENFQSNSLNEPQILGAHNFSQSIQESLLTLLKTTQFSTLDEMIAELETWEAPEEIRKNYVYYLAGHDEDGRPIWTIEVGKWDLRKIIEAGNGTFKDFDKYVRQYIYRAVTSMHNNTRASHSDVVEELIMIEDLDELSFYQLASVPTVGYFLTLVRDITSLLNKHLDVGYFLNVNYPAERLLELMRPILGPVFAKVHVFGNNRSKWIPHLLRRIPKNQLPEWYGGSKDYKPVAVYG